MTPRLALCAIVGNVEHYIERFLRAFAPVADEIVLVRAIGDQPPDRTLDIARDVVSQLSTKDSQPSLVTAEHPNAPAHAAWPHTDHFAAARQKSFDLATTDWVIWADTDDVITPDTAALIRAAFARYHADFDGFCIDYAIPEDGLRVQKERILHRRRGAWRYPIHEEFKFHEDKPRLIHIRDALYLHAPIGPRRSNDERNLRLLQSIPPAEITLGQRFHLVQSLRATGRQKESTATAVELLKEKELGPDERYELLMNIAEKTTDHAAQGNIYLQALGTNPRRREAYGELGLWSIITGRFQHALGFTRAMMAIPRPTEYVWTTRAMYYGWYGVKLHALALRANGHRAAADVLQFNHFKKHGQKISLLHATRGRAARAYQAQHEWLTAAADPDSIEHIFAIDADDQPSLPLALQRAVVVPGGGGCVAAWNAAAAASTGRVMVQMSDDWTPPLHWDRQILERLGDLDRPAVLAINDGHRPDDLLCMAILTRARYQQQGHLFHPRFKSMYSDNYFTHCAHRDGVIIPARDLIFHHNHPAFDQLIPVDQTYAESNAPARYEEGKAIFEELLASEN